MPINIPLKKGQLISCIVGVHTEYDTSITDVMKKSSAKPSIKGKPSGFLDKTFDVYKNPMKWQFVKHTAIFILAIWAARSLSDIDLMAPPEPIQ